MLPQLGEQRPRAPLGARRGLSPWRRLPLHAWALLGDVIVERHVGEIRTEAAELLRVADRKWRHGFLFPAWRSGKTRVGAPAGPFLIPDGSFLAREGRAQLLRGGTLVCPPLDPLLVQPPSLKARLSGGRGTRCTVSRSRRRFSPVLGQKRRRGGVLVRRVGGRWQVEHRAAICGGVTRQRGGSSRKTQKYQAHSLCKRGTFPGFPLTGVSRTLAMAASLLAALIIFFSALLDRKMTTGRTLDQPKTQPWSTSRVGGSKRLAPCSSLRPPAAPADSSGNSAASSWPCLAAPAAPPPGSPRPPALDSPGGKPSRLLPHTANLSRGAPHQEATRFKNQTHL